MNAVLEVRASPFAQAAAKPTIYPTLASLLNTERARFERYGSLVLP